MRFLLALLCLAAADVAIAGPDAGAAAKSAASSNDGCADATKLVGICDAVYKKWDAPKGSPYDYMYEVMIRNAACAKDDDSEAVVARKVQAMWKKLQRPHLKCNQANSDVSRGDILKYAISQKNNDFLGLAVEVWKVDLNDVDASDGRTVLDYVKEERDRLQGTKFAAQLQEYYDFLRENGAKHKAEL